MDGRKIIVIDGDTVSVDGEKVRILNIDAPESFRSRCESELKLALLAKERLMLLLRAGEVTIARAGQDRYRRTLARLAVDGTDVGESLIREGFALPWKDGREPAMQRLQAWCG